MAEKNKAKDGLSKKDYLERLGPLQLELNQMARWLQATGQRLQQVERCAGGAGALLE